MVLLVLIAVACGLVASTYRIIGTTWDEPEHLAAGLQLLDRGVYGYDTQHPPFARLAIASGPYIAGARSIGRPGPSGEREGRDVLYGSPDPETTLILARLGALPFLAVLIAATWLWAQRYYGAAEAALAAAFVASAPVVLGHAGVAALDVPGAACCVLALYAGLVWLESPSYRRGLWAGLAAGLAIGTKLSALPFLGVSAVVLVAARSLVTASSQSEAPAMWHMVASAMLAVGAMIAVLWALYGGNLEGVWLSVRELQKHNDAGHLSYLLGEFSRSGWWYFYPIALAVKTTIPLLLFGLVGLTYLLWLGVCEHDWRRMAPALCFAAILVFCCVYSRINIGVRHVLILYPLLAIAAAAVTVALWRTLSTPPARGLIFSALLWLFASPTFAYPDYLAYFNAFAGDHPERILVDSDLDWGQDIERLEQALRERKIKSINLAYRGGADPNRERLPPVRLLAPGVRAQGWVAVSLLAKVLGSKGYAWLDAYRPVARVGKSIDLYYIPPPLGSD